MSASLSLPSDILESLLCLNCNKYLSIFPIYTRIDSTGALCGRCNMAEEAKFIRDEAYECIAQFLTFPCMNVDNGCNENHNPLKLEQHEQYCSFKKFECPSKNYSKCQWKGPRADLVEHFNSKHPNLVLKDLQFELSFLSSQEETYLLSHNKELFILKKEVDSRKAICICYIEHLKSSEESDKFGYFLKILSDNKNYFHKCAEKSTDDQMNVSQITADLVKEKLHGSTSCIVNINIYKVKNAEHVSTDEVATGDIEKEDDPKSNVNWDLLAELECPICYDYMLPPIFQCVDGHSLCGPCKDKISGICGLCKNEVKGTKNFTLEKMANRLIYPCKYNKAGCSYSSLATKIRDHESGCEFGPHVCPLSDSVSCPWKDTNTEVSDHVGNIHMDCILKNDKVDIKFERTAISNKEYLIIQKKKVFKLCYKYDAVNFYWTVQYVGSADVAKDYRFEIDLIDLSGSKLRSYHMGLVVPLTKLKDCFKTPGKYVFAPLEQVETFVTDTISFRVRVVKE